MTENENTKKSTSLACISTSQGMRTSRIYSLKFIYVICGTTIIKTLYLSWITCPAYQIIIGYNKKCITDFKF